MTLTLVLVALVVVAVIWAMDRQWCLKDVEKDLNGYLGDILVARDSSVPPMRVHFEAQAFALKSLIRKHFEVK